MFAASQFVFPVPIAAQHDEAGVSEVDDCSLGSHWGRGPTRAASTKASHWLVRSAAVVARDDSAVRDPLASRVRKSRARMALPSAIPSSSAIMPVEFG